MREKTLANRRFCGWTPQKIGQGRLTQPSWLALTAFPRESFRVESPFRGRRLRLRSVDSLGCQGVALD
jgi:hypothetical protein